MASIFFMTERSAVVPGRSNPQTLDCVTKLQRIGSLLSPETRSHVFTFQQSFDFPSVYPLHFALAFSPRFSQDSASILIGFYDTNSTTQSSR
jgi:hypothetical protein